MGRKNPTALGDMPEKIKPIKNYQHVTPNQRAFIVDASSGMKDYEIAEKLGLSTKTVRRERVKYGIEKDNKGNVIRVGKPPVKDHEKEEVVVKKNAAVDVERRKDFYKRKAANSLYYNNLQEQFSPNEIAFYLEEWANLCIQFEDILATEKRQIDEYIKAEILGNRILKNVKVTEDELAKLIPEIEAYRKSHDMNVDEEAQERDATLMQIVRSCSGASGAMANDYQKNVDLRNRILEELNARRTDRADQISRRGTTFMSLVEEFRNEKVREEHGRHIELLKIAKEKKQAIWRSPQLFPDGTKDCILVDENTIFPEKVFSRIEDLKEVIDNNFDKLYVYKNENIKTGELEDLGIKPFTESKAVPNDAIVLLGLQNLELIESFQLKNVRIISYFTDGETTYGDITNLIKEHHAANPPGN